MTLDRLFPPDPDDDTWAAAFDEAYRELRAKYGRKAGDDGRELIRLAVLKTRRMTNR